MRNCKLKIKLKSWSDDTLSWIETHPRVNCGKISRRCVPLRVACDYLLRSTVGAHLWESERESYCVWGNQWVRAAPLTTPQRVHPPLFVQGCLSRLSAEFSIKAFYQHQKKVPWPNLQAQQFCYCSYSTARVIDLCTYLATNLDEECNCGYYILLQQRAPLHWGFSALEFYVCPYGTVIFVFCSLCRFVGSTGTFNLGSFHIIHHHILAIETLRRLYSEPHRENMSR